MNLSKDSGEIIKLILPKFKECMIYKNLKNKTALDKLLIKLYNDIVEGHNFVKYKLKRGCMKAILKPLGVPEKPEIYESRFFPQTIKTYIEDRGKYQLIYKCSINNREITIRFTLFSENDLEHLTKYDNYAHLMYIWLYICDIYSLKKCANTLSVYVYLTPFDKNLPDKPITTIGTNNVNTAFTLACAVNGEIVLFRKEEWMKVFIHETFHSYGLDFSSYSSSSIKESIKQIFPIQSDFIIEEAYAETWARIINCAFTSYNSMGEKKKEEKKKEFLLYMDFCLQNERLFALYQCNKVLNFMGLTYEDIYSNSEKSMYLRKNLYREDTNVFSYYILTAILLNDYYGFMRWCEKNNIGFIRFNSTEKKLRDFGELIKDLYNTKSMHQGLNCISNSINNKLYKNKYAGKSPGLLEEQRKWVGNTTRMSCIELL